jgi:ABC-type amino acid transport substrate-binding protein
MENFLGIRFDRVPPKTWSDAVKMLEQGRVDVLSETTTTYRDSMIFTKPYVNFPVMIIGQKGNFFYQT